MVRGGQILAISKVEKIDCDGESDMRHEKKKELKGDARFLPELLTENWKMGIKY